MRCNFHFGFAEKGFTIKQHHYRKRQTGFANNYFVRFAALLKALNNWSTPINDTTFLNCPTYLNKFIYHQHDKVNIFTAPGSLVCAEKNEIK